jgi:ATP-dependent RNA helicase SUPV3L1/SUV3
LRGGSPRCYVDAGGVVQRQPLDPLLAQHDHGARQQLRGCGLIIGSLDLFHPGLLKPEAARLRLALLAVYKSTAMPPLPMAGLGLLDKPAPDLARAARVAGYHSFGSQMLRVDLVERIARALHDQRNGATAFTPQLDLATSLGIGTATLGQMLRALGFVRAQGDSWRWRGRRKPPVAERPARAGAFEALKSLRGIP